MARVAQTCFTRGSRMVPRWFGGVSHLVRGWHMHALGSGQGAPHVVCVVQMCVHDWFENGSRMVLGRFAPGSWVTSGQFGFGAGRPLVICVVQGWFMRG
eukprot:2964934-Pyramimonas_sp.AAC.1